MLRRNLMKSITGGAVAALVAKREARRKTKWTALPEACGRR
jgi:hypothetical protein